MSIIELFDLGNTQGWMEFAACRQTDPELFFPENTTVSHKVRKICRECPVLAACGEWIVDLESRLGVQPGFYAGMTEAERRVRRGPQCSWSGCLLPKHRPGARYCEEHRAVARRMSQSAYDARKKAS